jgi:hypothetical protein
LAVVVISGVYGGIPPMMVSDAGRLLEALIVIDDGDICNACAGVPPATGQLIVTN